MAHYGNIPKKRKVYVDKNGQVFGLGKGDLDESESVVYTGSGTLLPAGHLTVSGGQFKNTSVIISTYRGVTDPNGVAVASGTMAVELGVSIATFRGVPSSDFFYAVFN